MSGFLGLAEEFSGFERSRVHVLPMPYEATVSYGAGTRDGPRAIIVASQQVEIYDREGDWEPAELYGVHTLPALELPLAPEAAIDAIAQAVREAASHGKLVVGLGGEHTVSIGFGRGLVAARGGPLTVVQLDAHSDLRDSYDGSPFSHACVARRLLETDGIAEVLQLGIRSICREEVEFAGAHPDRLRIWFAEDVHAGVWREELIARLAGKRVYLTLDVDGLDPGVVPSTGTPEPDGLSWAEALDVLRTVAGAAPIEAIDCVELAPVPGQHASDYAVAKLVYKAMGYALRSPRWSDPPAPTA